MSALMDQHRAHKDRQARLGVLTVEPRARLSRRDFVALPPAVTVIGRYGAPFNFYAPPHAKNVIKLVALRHKVTVDDLVGPLKTDALVKARDEAIGLVYTHCKYISLPAIGRAFGRHHTSILHTLRKLRLMGKTVYRRRVYPQVSGNDINGLGASPGITHPIVALQRKSDHLVDRPTTRGAV